MTGRPGWGASAASTPATWSSPARAASPASSCWPCGAPWGPTAPSATQSTSTPSILRQETLEATRNIGKNWPQGHAPTILVPILILDPQLITWNFTIGSENHANNRYLVIQEIFKNLYRDNFQLETLPRSDSMTLGDTSLDSSNNHSRHRLKKSSQKSIVGALNQGLVSLGEKLGKPSSNFSCFTQKFQFIWLEIDFSEIMKPLFQFKKKHIPLWNNVQYYVQLGKTKVC